QVARAEQLLAEGKFSQANTLLDAVMAVGAGRALRLRKVQALVGAGKHDEAYAMTTTLMKQDGNVPAVLLARAKCLYAMGNLDSAVKHLQEAARQDPDSTAEYRDLIRQARAMEATKERGNQAFKAGSWHEAIVAWTEAAAIDPENKLFNSKLFFNRRAGANARLRRHADAVRDASAAIALDHAYAKAYHRRAQSLLELGGAENLEACVRDYEVLAGGLETAEGAQREVRAKLHQAQAALKQARRKDYYKILCVERGATEDEIKKAY
ncbi:unnamed protein product, partial [Phaeothamnion confervicola]